MDKLDEARKVVGLRSLLKGLAGGTIETAYLADDADMFLRMQVTEACEKANVKLVIVKTMEELGVACGVEVKTAAAGIRKQ